jgi:hypothetical protein
MGLDMNAYKVLPEFLVDPEAQVDLEIKAPDSDETNVVIEIAYWRKFHHLHGWMERLYRSKGGKDETFNCNSVRLMPADILQLALDASNGLEATGGFFFGSSAWDQERKDEVLAFCKLANDAINDGYVVLYDSWW